MRVRVHLAHFWKIMLFLALFECSSTGSIWLQALKAYCPHKYTLSSGQNNFSFFNRKKIESSEELEPYLEALHQTRQDIADGTLIYDPEITYMNFIVGDGDNIAFMKGKLKS